MTLGERMKKRRLAAGYSQEYVAEKAGVTQAHYSYCENDHPSRRPTLWLLVALAKLYEMELMEAFPEFRMTPRERRQWRHAKALP